MLARRCAVVALTLLLASCNRSRSSDRDRDADARPSDADLFIDAGAGDVGVDDATLDTTPDAAIDVASDAAIDAAPDAATDTAPDGGLDAGDDAPDGEDDTPIFVEVGTGDADVASDVPPEPETLLAWIADDGANAVIRVASLEAPDIARTVHRATDDLSHLRFAPDSGLLYFLSTTADGTTQVGELNPDTEALRFVAPSTFDGTEFRLVVGLDVLADGTLVLTGNSASDPALRLFFVDAETGTTRYGTFPGDGRQHREAIDAPFGFGVVYSELTPPGPADLWFDGMADAAPMQLTDGVPVSDDLAVWPGRTEGTVLFTNPERRLCSIATAPFDPVAPPFSDYACSTDVEEFHPRPTPDGCCVVTSRYPPEVSTRPTPRDLYLVDIVSGEVVRPLTSTRMVSERWPDVYRPPAR